MGILPTGERPRASAQIQPGTFSPEQVAAVGSLRTVVAEFKTLEGTAMAGGAGRVVGTMESQYSTMVALNATINPAPSPQPTATAATTPGAAVESDTDNTGAIVLLVAIISPFVVFIGAIVIGKLAEP